MDSTKVGDLQDYMYIVFVALLKIIIKIIIKHETAVILKHFNSLFRPISCSSKKPNRAEEKRCASLRYASLPCASFK